jgi:nucleoside phosphorylase
VVDSNDNSSNRNQPEQLLSASLDGGHNPLRRLGLPLESRLVPALANAPALPAINWSLVAQQAPVQLTTPATNLPIADAVVITWTSAEWAAMEHVCCTSATAMAYGARTTSSWPNWQQYAAGMPGGAAKDWTYWGRYRLIQVAGHRVLLFKSNTHLDWPGPTYLQQLINILISHVHPGLIISIGTAGGAQPADHLGTVRAVSAATYDQAGQPRSAWPTYSSSWAPSSPILAKPGFQQLLLPIPSTHSDLQALADALNKKRGTTYSLSTLDPDGLSMADAHPFVANQTAGAAISLLTTSTFVVGTTDGAYQAYACIEMDDAIIGQACSAAGTQFGFVRNVSDPAQSASLPANIQGGWGSAVYDAYGFYTSYNGALAAWGLLVDFFGP